MEDNASKGKAEKKYDEGESNGGEAMARGQHSTAPACWARRDHSVTPGVSVPPHPTIALRPMRMPAGGPNHIKLPYNPCGCVYALSVDSQLRSVSTAQQACLRLCSCIPAAGFAACPPVAVHHLLYLLCSAGACLSGWLRLHWPNLAGRTHSALRDRLPTPTPCALQRHQHERSGVRLRPG